ncbi:MAG: DUF1501 domain-containing protein [Actinomycetota bacterium]|jgi:uncharacterized protein (DUF1501 family)|nr:DUF1501 domain-containing protein [Actinomycetota bacterium]
MNDSNTDEGSNVVEASGGIGDSPGGSQSTPREVWSVNRRKFLALAGGFGAAGVLSATLGPRLWEDFFGSVPKEAAVGPPPLPLTSVTSKRPLVLVTLYGGNDGLNTVIPYQSSVYQSNRGQLAIDAAKVLPLGEGYGLHPSMTGFKRLWEAKQLAIVQGVGFANPNFSHFESMDIWQSGVPGEPVSSGWLGRWLDATSSSPLRAVSIGPTMPTLLTGEKVQGAAIPPGKLVLPGDSTEQMLFAALSQISSGSPQLLSEAAAACGNLVEMSRQMGPTLSRTAASDPLHLAGATSSALAANGGAALAIADGGGGESTPNVLATQLSIVANLILAGAVPQVYSVDLGGFDTHVSQQPTQAKLLGELDMAVTAFVDALANTSSGHGVVVLIYTEFGRRVNANSNEGTDHGWANNVFVVGPAVKGGFYGEPPDLKRLQEGNLVFTTDFRSVYATMFDKVLGVDPKPFLQGSFNTLSMV